MKADVYVPEGVPVIRGTNIGQHRTLKGDWVFVTDRFADGIENCVVKPGDLIFPHRGAIGEVALIEQHHGRMVLSTSMMKFRPNPQKASSEFLYYFFRSDAGRNEILRFGSQVGTPGIGQPLTSLRQFRAPLPPLYVQHSIAEVLSALDDKIDLNRRMSETLEAMAQAIFRDWFVEFGPTRRKVEGATDPVAIMGGLVLDPDLARQVADLFPATVGEDGLPDGWFSVTASRLIEFNPSEPLKRGAVAPYSDMSSLPTVGTIAEPPILREFGSGMRFRNGDTLFARITPCLENGKAAFVDFLPDGKSVGWGSTEFIVLRARPSVPAPFAYLLVRHDEFRDRAIRSMTGTSGRQRAQADSVASFLTVQANEQVFEAFGQLIVPLFDLISANGRQSRTLAANRDLLLPKLMSGAIAVRQAEEALA
ncbi:restriction endonuclease subunit S [Mesorhizobium sp. M6A.T.Cr.TU.014.01.1.1]|uniref:restriction endonuclease subunit S n=1 Tax=Mesorhizobium sp. M6A.T.Cr.TU.014.01.1.1 TaxID=2496676 RepID=UPI000FD2F0C8|nr:restriction endonuclease subunit S [Mesorhizobium sp. M6A.T.Cr.TU.014.01.1.1]RVB77205.1 restriction endonuclease subunit S [Mesorhizobium sp. M6A.T.Cr.TU.014.01.1.1]RWQ05253.1 MAG: restriction endonuclease subunit S [Mesorhizobium sp.]RWQ10289.1 MAG: restriction endonuclease subunit S [Mesorhizobium sp.]